MKLGRKGTSKIDSDYPTVNRSEATRGIYLDRSHIFKEECIVTGFNSAVAANTIDAFILNRGLVA